MATSDSDLDSLRALIGRLIVNAGGPASRAIEEAMGIGHGRIPQVLSGRLPLRASHLTRLARYLEIAPSELFVLGCPEAERAARRKIEEWIGLPAPRFAAEPKKGGISTELEERIRQIAREEIAAPEKRGSRSGG